MATRLYNAINGAQVTTAAPVKVTTTTAIKTLMQLATSATAGLEIVEWGISFDGAAATTPGVCELLDTTVAATTLTAYGAGDINKMSRAQGGLASTIQLGASLSGFNTSGGTEGTPANVIQFDTQLLPPTAPYIKQFPLERGPTANNSEFVRVRVTFGTAINALCYVVWAE
jgi:hypothetical protein